MNADLIEVDSATNFSAASSVYADSNLLIYAVDKSSDLHAAAAELIAKLKAQKIRVFISSLVIDEVLFKLTRQGGLSKDEAVERVNQFRSLGYEIADMDGEPVCNIATRLFQLSFEPRDSFHLACTVHNKISGFVTSDGKIATNYMKLQFPIAIYHYGS